MILPIGKLLIYRLSKMTKASCGRVFDQCVDDIEISLRLVTELEEMLENIHSTPDYPKTTYYDVDTRTNLQPVCS